VKPPSLWWVRETKQDVAVIVFFCRDSHAR